MNGDVRRNILYGRSQIGNHKACVFIRVFKMPNKDVHVGGHRFDYSIRIQIHLAARPIQQARYYVRTFYVGRSKPIKVHINVVPGANTFVCLDNFIILFGRVPFHIYDGILVIRVVRSVNVMHKALRAVRHCKVHLPFKFRFGRICVVQMPRRKKGVPKRHPCLLRHLAAYVEIVQIIISYINFLRFIVKE